MSEDVSSPESKSPHIFPNKAKVGYTPFLDDAKFVHISSERLKAYAEENNIELDPIDAEQGVVLIDYSGLEHLAILAEGLGLDYYSMSPEETGELQRFGVANAGLTTNIYGKIIVFGSSDNVCLENESRSVYRVKDRDSERARKMDEKTAELLNDIYEGDFSFRTLSG